MKNYQSGFIGVLILRIIGIVAILILSGFLTIWFLDKNAITDLFQVVKNTTTTTTTNTNPETEKLVPTIDTASSSVGVETSSSTPSSVPASSSTSSNIVAKVSSGPTITLGEGWFVFQRFVQALKIQSVRSLNSVSYKPIPTCGSNCSQMFSFVYSSVKDLKREDFVNVWSDGRQMILSTNPIKQEDATSLNYTKNYLYFVRGADGSIKFLQETSPSWGHTKVGTNLTEAQIDAEVQAMMVDTDKDGLTDMNELKTDPKKRDSVGDGWWDGVRVLIQ